MTHYLSSYGYVGLRAFSFLAATIVSVSPEAALASALALDMQPMSALILAAIGNCVGAALNFWLVAGIVNFV